MQVFVTGSGGHIGTAVVSDLISGGHTVVGLVRSNASAAVVSDLGAQVLQGDVNDVRLLQTAAENAQAVIHLVYDNAAVARGDLTSPAKADLAAVRVIADAIADTGKTFIGIGITTTGDPVRDRMLAANPRHAVAAEVAAFAERGIRSMLVAVPPVTHSDRDRHGFIPALIGIARERNVSGYLGEGQNHWPAVHTLDLARLYRLALESAPTGAQIIGAAESGVPLREIAEAIGRRLGVPAESIPAEAAAGHFGTFAFAGMDIVMPNEATRNLLGWKPDHPTLIEDIEAGHYFT